MLIPVEEHHLRVLDLGRGTPLLLHNGWVASSELWLPLVELLQHDWRCLAYDHRGTGGSTFPPEAIAAPALVDDVFRVLDALGIDRCVVAGESMGCLVVQQAVLRDPSRFLGVVLVGGMVRGRAPSDEVARRIRDDWPGYVEAFVAACIPEPDSLPLRRAGGTTLLPAGPEAGVTMMAAHGDVAPPLEDIGVRTLVVHGAADVVVPLEVGREAAARIPGAELVVVDDAGHVPIFTRPQVVADALTAWWSRVTA